MYNKNNEKTKANRKCEIKKVKKRHETNSRIHLLTLTLNRFVLFYFSLLPSGFISILISVLFLQRSPSLLSSGISTYLGGTKNTLSGCWTRKLKPLEML